MTSRDQHEEDDLLADYFEKSATAVRDTFGRFEHDIAQPVTNYVLLSFKKRPILSTFVAFYLALSALPVLSFIGFALFVFATSVFIALATAILGASCAVGFFAFWLACTLAFFLFVSFNLTASTLATYLFARFVLRARKEGLRPTLSAVLRDTRGRLSAARGRNLATKSLADKKPAEHSESEGETMVIVGTPAPKYGEKVPGVPVEAT